MGSGGQHPLQFLGGLQSRFGGKGLQVQSHHLFSL
jgi:hypothetical protein